VEAFLVDQPLGDLRALAIELVRAVRRLADEDQMRVADHLQQRVVIAAVTGDRMHRTANGLEVHTIPSTSSLNTCA